MWHVHQKQVTNVCICWELFSDDDYKKAKEYQTTPSFKLDAS